MTGEIRPGPFDLADKVVLVTGAASGIGAAVARVAAECGARVGLLDRDAEACTELAVSIDGLAVAADISVQAEVGAAIDSVARRLGAVDVVVHAAGIDDPDTKARTGEAQRRGESVDVLRTLEPASWHRLIDVNLHGSFYVLQAAARHMVPRRQGSIVLVGSVAGVHGISGLPHYAASKGGVHALVRAGAKELVEFGIRVNGVAPGVVDTPMSRRTPGYYDAPGTPPVTPLGRAGRPEEVAHAALFLASDLATFIVGEVINVDGGRLCS